ncbi:hypothetical protein G9A89_021266 [Geosiphon pyriformis]|nr:hypothetical protein G9A89_021266 [Geosiphon pyriformis]
MSAITVINKATLEPTANFIIIHNWEINIKTPIATTVLSNLSAPPNSNTTTEPTSKQNPKAKTDTTELEINSDTGYTQNPNFQNYLSLLVTPKDSQPNNPKTNQQPTLTSNIPPATITENESLDAIFPFELKKLSTMLLFSRATLEEKLITAMYTDAKVDGHSIKLILDSGSAGSIITRQLMDQLGYRVDCATSACIITVDGATKTPISKIDDLPIEVNDIIVCTGEGYCAVHK